MIGTHAAHQGKADDSFRKILELATGGMGVVELVAREEARFTRLYARKRLRSEFRQDDAFREMFMEEARLAGLLRHPNVVSVLDVGEDESGPYLLMDFVDGVSLSQLLRKLAATASAIPLQHALAIVEQAARGLHAAHELTDREGDPLRLVHRDVSPQNVLIGFDGISRVTDFGIAKARGRSTKTESGVLKGKLGYFSPEQLQFEEPTRRSDLFSLGVVLFELVTGRRLYRSADGMDGPRRILTEPPPDLGHFREDASAELVCLCFDLLAKDPAHRPETARQVADTLRQIWLDEVLAEGPLDLSSYIDELFHSEQRDREQHVRDALQAADSSGEGGPRGARAWWLWAAAASVAVLAMSAFAAWPHAEPEAAARPERTRPVAQAPAATTPSPTASSVVPRAAPLEDEEEELVENAVEQAPDEVEAAPDPPSPRATRRRARPRPAPSAARVSRIEELMESEF
ncbi:MAG: protein kinase [Sandaracinaceae bacterium]